MILGRAKRALGRVARGVFPTAEPAPPAVEPEPVPEPEPPPEPPPEETWEALREREAAAAVAGSPADFKRYHQARAASYRDLRGGRVLVIGCNRGEDCEYFVELGVDEVIGLDVMDEIGQAYIHPAVSYIQASAEAVPLASAGFDLVFAYATLEHVPDIRAAFGEMARLAAPGGTIYSAAAPLWCTRAGPHWGSAFHDEPWPHLRMSVDEILAVAARMRAAGSEDMYHEAKRLTHFLTDPLLFNRRRAHEYLDACVVLDEVDILRNDIEMEQQSGYDPAIVRSLVAGGYMTVDLFGLTHLFIARRR